MLFPVLASLEVLQYMFNSVVCRRVLLYEAAQNNLAIPWQRAGSFLYNYLSTIQLLVLHMD